MAIALEFIDFIVPIATIKAKYPGGREQCLKDHEDCIDGRVWFDEHLFRDGAMNPYDIEALVEKWTLLGFKPRQEVNGVLHWKDLCVAEWMFGGATLECDWLEYGFRGRSAYLKGTEPGEIVSTVARGSAEK